LHRLDIAAAAKQVDRGGCGRKFICFGAAVSLEMVVMAVDGFSNQNTYLNFEKDLSL
jgi:hypothetical protein